MSKKTKNFKENEAEQKLEAEVEEVIEVESSESEVLSDDAIEVEAESFNEDDSEETETEVEEDDMMKLAKALMATEAALKESQDRYTRTMAEFENFRKRTLREKSQMHENGSKEILEKLLPVVDNFERAIDHITDEEKDLAITKGVEMIYKQLMGTLNEVGVEEIEALNNEFDPNLHHAVSHEDNEDYDDNLVQDVFQKGYMFKDSVLRHSMVKVVN